MGTPHLGCSQLVGQGGQATLLSGVIAAQSGSGSLEQNGHRAGQPPEKV